MVAGEKRQVVLRSTQGPGEAEAGELPGVDSASVFPRPGQPGPHRKADGDKIKNEQLTVRPMGPCTPPRPAFCAVRAWFPYSVYFTLFVGREAHTP